MANGNGEYKGLEKRSRDRIDHNCIHEADFGEIKSNLGFLGRQIKDHVKEQKEKNIVFYEKFDTVSTNLIKVSTDQETLPGKIVELLDEKKAKQFTQHSAKLKYVSTAIAVLVAIGGGIFWLVNFVQHNAVNIP